MGDGNEGGIAAAEVEVVKTEVEEIADGGESGGEGGARHCASYGSGPAVTRGGRERVQSGGAPHRRAGCIWGARERRGRSTRWWHGMRAQPLAAKRECLWSSLLLRREIVTR